MATFMLGNTVICVKATKLTYEEDSVLAWNGEEVTAAFKLADISSCWLEEAMV